MKRAEWSLVGSNGMAVVIRDERTHDLPSITNDAENVVADLLPALRGRRLFYYDTQGQLDELLVKDGKFAGFAPGPRPGRTIAAVAEFAAVEAR